MDQVCLVLPILPGKSDSARAFQAELDGPRKSDYDTSERRIGITKEAWFIAQTPAGDEMVAYIESADFNKAFSMFVQSQDEFDLWFKERLADATGVDLNDPPDLTLPELVSRYETADQTLLDRIALAMAACPTSAGSPTFRSRPGPTSAIRSPDVEGGRRFSASS